MSRKVARGVSAVSVLCPRTVDYFVNGGSLSSWARRVSVCAGRVRQPGESCGSEGEGGDGPGGEDGEVDGADPESVGGGVEGVVEGVGEVLERGDARDVVEPVG